MNLMLHIRREVFGATQSAFAEKAGVSQGTVSRWERGEFEPTREQLSRIRDAARERGIEWRDEWFFDQPPIRINADPGDEHPERAA